MKDSNIKIKNTVKALIIYGYIKPGIIFTVNNTKYKFVGFTYDRVDNEEIILHVLYNFGKHAYTVKKEKDYENSIARILEEQC